MFCKPETFFRTEIDAQPTAFAQILFECNLGHPDAPPFSGSQLLLSFADLFPKMAS